MDWREGDCLAGSDSHGEAYSLTTGATPHSFHTDKALQSEGLFQIAGANAPSDRTPAGDDACPWHLNFESSDLGMAAARNDPETAHSWSLWDTLLADQRKWETSFAHRAIALH